MAKTESTGLTAATDSIESDAAMDADGMIDGVHVFDFTHMIALKTWAASVDVDAKRARRFARNGKLDAAYQLAATGDVWLIDDRATAPAALTAPATRGRSTRVDGRQRFVVHATSTEMDAIHAAFPDVSITNPRDVSKQRRADKRAAADVATPEQTAEIVAMLAAESAKRADARADAIASTKPDGALVVDDAYDTDAIAEMVHADMLRQMSADSERPSDNTIQTMVVDVTT